MVKIRGFSHGTVWFHHETRTGSLMEPWPIFLAQKHPLRFHHETRSRVLRFHQRYTYSYHVGGYAKLQGKTTRGPF
ncbi:hypothetical protein LAL4801_01139 [Roseibium aggregatum]|uniref:Uncharacterized protein n=1 Tax=Roseibium aggregatum TaxID=187304 RepID=A0A0M6XZ15_9HYPH|nr:hypothetical protein LAL4801_01139 [Roseibium aggregatum]